MKRSLFARAFAIVAFTVLASAAVITGVGLGTAERAYLESNASSLMQAAAAVSSFVPSGPSGDIDRPAAKVFAAETAKKSGFRVTVIGPDGAVLADSDVDPSGMDNHADRVEVTAALAGRQGWSRRASATLGKPMLYAAAPILLKSISSSTASVPAGVLRLALPLPGIMERQGSASLSFILVALGAVLAALVASGILIRLLAKPVASLALRAGRYASGDRSVAVGETLRRNLEGGQSPREFLVLSEALDSLASELTKRVDEAEGLGKRYSTILESAGEAILALDSSLVITEANPAAYEMLGAEAGTLIGASLSRASGSEALSVLAKECLGSGERKKAEVALYGKSERTLQASVTPLGESGVKGLVLAISDISVIKRLETMRKDFVANVSHELRTPIQLIRGFAETLRADDLRPEERERYLGIIEKNALRMERIVSDLLDLARLERDPAAWLTMESCEAGAVIAEVAELSKLKTIPHNVEIIADCPERLVFTANSGLVEQALLNLVENAVRYSPDGGLVRIEARLESHNVVFKVRDSGKGIPAPDLERIFERFYRADKSRDRSTGGTGLGLAIVRHIALAHGGSVEAESWTGEGSVFTLRFPIRPDTPGY